MKENFFGKWVIGVDPGSEICGVAVLCDGRIVYAANLTHDQFWGNIQSFLIYPNCKIALEDIRAYSMRLTPQVMETCIWIGGALNSLKMVLKQDQILRIPRATVKKFVYDNHKDIAEELVREKIEKGNKKHGKYLTNVGVLREPSSSFVDDRIVKKIMISRFGIEIPKRGKPFEYSLSEHSWQALAVACVADNEI